MWTRHARVGCGLWLSSTDKDTFEGWHDGYLRLEDPVKHRRLIELDKRSRRIVVEDTVEAQYEHEVELFFHCAEDCQVEAVEGGYLIGRGNVAAVKLLLPALQGAESAVQRGSLAPTLGWVSRSFDVRVPAATIAWRARTLGRVVLRTEIVVLA